MITFLMKLGIEGMYLNILKAIPHTEWGKIETISYKSGRRQGCLISPLLFNILLEFLARAER
jgi:hypothetical protein